MSPASTSPRLQRIPSLRERRELEIKRPEWEKNRGSDMGEKVCLITGATSGIGKATAMGLANMGASVVMVGRTRGRGEAVMAEITVLLQRFYSGVAHCSCSEPMS